MGLGLTSTSQDLENPGQRIKPRGLISPNVNWQHEYQLLWQLSDSTRDVRSLVPVT